MNLYNSFLTQFSNYFIQGKQKHLILHITNHCNFRCAHCFVDFSGKNKDLKIDDYKKIANNINDLLWLDVGGGEPFLRKDLYEIVNLFKKQVVAIPTNGFLTENIIDQVQKIDTSNCELTINFSLDGLKDTHNKIRKNKESWDKVWYTFEKLKKFSKVKLRVITVICNENINEIIPLMKEVQSRGVDFHSVMLLRGETLDENIELPDIQTLKLLAKEMFPILSKYDYGVGGVSSHILRNYHRYMWKVSLETLEKETQIVPCLAGKSNVVIWGNGDLSSCEMLPSVGNVTNNSVDEILSSEKFHQQLKSIKNKECHCTHNCALLTSIFFNPKKWGNLIVQKKP
jgi:MoaA/NifB/PqqE/SkfB family radical SAM enzyme|tara:strand:+ start:589 stop:1614 length:1026 start_codon:yes stop_codon:yes gene_type:complete